MNFIVLKEIILSILLCTAFSDFFCQVDEEIEMLIKEVEEKLKNNSATISQIFTDKKYDAIHPEASFKEILQSRKHIDTITGRKIKVI